MGTKYSANSESGYNATAPDDDGTVSEANKVKWSTIKTKLGDPLKTLAEAIDSDLQTHFNVGPNAYTSNQTLGASHYNTIVEVSGAGVTLTLTDAATLGAGWYCRIVNTDSTNNVTIGRATAGDTANGTAADFTLTALHAIDVFVIAAATGFLIRSAVINPVTTDTAQNISGDKTFTGTVTQTSTDAGAGAGPVYDAYRNSASPAASDVLGAFRASGENSTGGKVTYAQINGSIVDPTATSEDGRVNFQTIVAGTVAVRGYIDNGMVMGSATGGDRGAGTHNATQYYKNGVRVVPDRVKVYRDATASINNNTATPVGFNVEDLDEAGAHSVVSNAERITIPTGYTKARFFAQAVFAANATGYRQINIHKNGAALSRPYGVTVVNSGGVAPDGLQIQTDILDVSATDYFTVVVLQTSGAALDVSANSTFFYAELY